MIFDELLKSHEAAVLRAGSPGDDTGRDDHFGRVALYASKIRALRAEAAKAPRPALPSRPPAVIYGTSPTLESWEDEGGSLKPPAPLPAAPVAAPGTDDDGADDDGAPAP